MYRLLSHRFATSPGHEESQARFDDLMSTLGHDLPPMSPSTIPCGAAELGNHLAQQMIAFGLADGANESADYANQVYETVNPDLELAAEGNDGLVDPNAWQPLSIPVFVDQAGNVLSETPDFQGAEWGQVAPFALSDSVRQNYDRAGEVWPVYLDCGPPPSSWRATLVGDAADAHAWGFALVALWSGHLDSNDDTTMWDISPATSATSLSLGPPPSLTWTPSTIGWKGEMWHQGTRSIQKLESPMRPTPCCVGTMPGCWLNSGPMVPKVRRHAGTLVCAVEWGHGSPGLQHPLAWSRGRIGSFALRRPGVPHAGRRTCTTLPLQHGPTKGTTITSVLYRPSATWLVWASGRIPPQVSYHPGGLPLVPGHIEVVEAGRSACWSLWHPRGQNQSPRMARA